MPSEVMEQRSFFEEICFPSEKQVPKAKAMLEHQVGMNHGMTPIPGNKLDHLSSLEKHFPQEESVGGQGIKGSKLAWKPMDHDLKLWSDMCTKPASYSFDGKNTTTNGIQHESSLFSSSLSEIFCRKLQLSGNGATYPQPAKEEPSLNFFEESEGQTIGNLLPDDDDLFSGMTDVLGHAHANAGDDNEDFDLFSNSGGFELGEDRSSVTHGKYEVVGGVLNGQMGGSGSISVEHPSRTLFVRNINSSIEDSELKALFKQYGDIRTLYTACKHRGFIIISYYDIRAARNAMRALQNRPLKHRNLDIHYSIPKENPSDEDINQGILVISNLDSSISNNELCQIFGIYGEIKHIQETQDKHRRKVIEFYDIRAAEMAARALSKTNGAGKQIKVEPFFNGVARQSLVQMSNIEQEEHAANMFHSFGENLSSAPKAKASPVGITSSGMVLGAHSAMIGSVENGFAHQSSSLPNILPVQMRMATGNKQFGFCEPSNSLDDMKFGDQRIHGFHPHSLPDNHDSFAHTVVSNPSSAMSSMSNFGIMESFGSHPHVPNGNRRPGELKGVYGAYGSGGNPVAEHQSSWNSPSSYQQLSSSPLGLRNSPSFVNGLHERRFPRPHMMSSSPLAHHIGSAPAINPSLWERLAYSPGNSALPLSSHGSPGFPSSPQLHFMDIAPQKMFSQATDMTINAAHSPHHIFTGRNPISMPTSFDSLRESARNLSHRRSEANSNNMDKKQYDLDVERILRGDDKRTTLMIKNIPNKYTSKMLLAAIDEYCRGTYDFLYLPIDFKNKCNVGYAFINMIDPRQIIPFHQAFNGKKWEKFNSEKVATLAYARIQGKTALIAHFQNSSLMNEDKRCRPILFHTDGPNAGDPEPFPMGTSIRSRPGRSRASGNEEENSSALDSMASSLKDSD